MIFLILILYLLTVVGSAIGILFFNTFTKSFVSVTRTEYDQFNNIILSAYNFTKEDFNRIILLSLIPIVNISILFYQFIKFISIKIYTNLTNINYKDLPNKLQ